MRRQDHLGALLADPKNKTSPSRSEWEAVCAKVWPAPCPVLGTWMLRVRQPKSDSSSRFAPPERQVDDLNAAQLGAKIKQYGIKSPDGNELSDPYPFNLMFATSIGPSGLQQVRDLLSLARHRA